MESKIQKLIADYEKQIIEYDRCLQLTKDAELKLKKDTFNKNYLYDCDDLAHDRQVLNAQRQRTVQFISDLKYL